MSVTVATYNLCNLGADTPADRIGRLARDIATHLGGPHLLVVQEVTGGAPAADGSVPGEAAFAALVGAIARLGGPHYTALEVAPLDGRDGGLRGANIRVGILYDGTRIGFRKRGIPGPADGTGFRKADGEAQLTLNPGRVAPAHPAFEGDPAQRWAPSRKALAAEFALHCGQRLLVVACHLKSMRAETRRAEDYAKRQRHAQAAVLNEFVRTASVLDPGLGLVVAGDMNDVPGSKTLRILKGGHLLNLVDDLPRSTCYTRRHGSRPQALDHILVSPRLAKSAETRIFHLNSDAKTDKQASDHDPVLVTLDLQ